MHVHGCSCTITIIASVIISTQIPSCPKPFWIERQAASGPPAPPQAASGPPRSMGKTPSPDRSIMAPKTRRKPARSKGRCGGGTKFCKGCRKQLPASCFAVNQNLDFDCKKLTDRFYCMCVRQDAKEFYHETMEDNEKLYLTLEDRHTYSGLAAHVTTHGSRACLRGSRFQF